MNERHRGWSVRMLGCVAWMAVVLAIEHSEPFLEFGRQLGMFQAAALEEHTGTFAPVQYGFLSRAGYRPVEARLVQLITLRTGVEPAEILLNVCPQRAFLAELIKALNIRRVQSIIVDKYFSKSACPKGDAGTAQLVEAVRTSAAPIVLGWQTELTAEGLKSVEDQLFDATSLGENARLGLLRLNRDTRKIPLEWPVANARQGPLQIEQLASLPLVAAELKNSRLRAGRLGPLLASRTHPFASFIRGEELPESSSLDVVCAEGGATRWGSCRTPIKLADLKGRIAIIGNATEQDRHESVVGEVPGVVLHANYIEALLDDRFFVPLDGGMSVGLVMLLSGIIYLLFWLVPSAERALLISLGGLTAFVGIGYFVLAFSGRILASTIEAAGLLGFVLLRYLESRGHLLGHSDHPETPSNELVETPDAAATQNASVETDVS